MCYNIPYTTVQQNIQKWVTVNQQIVINGIILERDDTDHSPMCPVLPVYLLHSIYWATNNKDLQKSSDLKVPTPAWQADVIVTGAIT